MKRLSIALGVRSWVIGVGWWVIGVRCWVMGVSCLLIGCSPSVSDTSSLTILFTGDVLLDRGVRPVAEHKGIGYIFEEVSPIFREADAVMINLECPLTDTVSPVSKKFIFRADARWANDLKSAGITHAAMANNHTNDQGRRGLQATVQHLQEAGIRPVGYGRNFKEQITPVLIEKDGISVAVFNATTLIIENWLRLDGKPGIAQPSEDELIEAVTDYRRRHSDTHIVVVLHWGFEFQSYPSIRQKALAHKLSDAGVDAVVGHHPHVLQPMEMIGQMPVFYSIGNFVFDQKAKEARESMIARLTFKSDGSIEADSIAVEIDKGRPLPIE